MATQTPAIIAPDQTGTAALTLAAPGLGAGNGDLVPTSSIIWVKNANASSMTVTIKMTGTTVDGQTITDKTVTVGATTNMLIGPFTDNMKQSSGTGSGYVLVEYSSVTSLTRAVIDTPW